MASLAAGDTHYATGRASITDGNGNTAYPYTGVAGPPGPPGPSGTTFFDYGTVVISSDANGNLSCFAINWHGPDASSVQVVTSSPFPSAFVVSGFPPRFIVEVTPEGSAPALGTTVHRERADRSMLMTQ